MFIADQFLYLLLLIFGVIAIIYIVLYMSNVSQKRSINSSKEENIAEDGTSPKSDTHSSYEVGICKTIGDEEIQQENCDVQFNNNCCMAVLTDGKGQNSLCKSASNIVVKTFSELFLKKDVSDNTNYFLSKTFNIANKNILSVLGESGKATAACAIINKGYLYYGLIGESRIAIFRGDSLIQLTVGHTINAYAKQQYYQGNLTKKKTLSLLENKNVYNYLGRDGFEGVELSEQPIKLKNGDILVVMSDGIFKNISWVEMEKYLAQSSSCSIKSQRIIGAIESFEEIKKGNASIILVRYIGR